MKNAREEPGYEAEYELHYGEEPGYEAGYELHYGVRNGVNGVSMHVSFKKAAANLDGNSDFLSLRVKTEEEQV